MEEGSFSTYVGALAAACLGLLAIVAAVSYRYDPANLFGNLAYEAEVARLLAHGRNVANVTHHDERLLQKFYVQELDRANDVVVLGSSRSMQVGRRLFPGLRFFNHSVSGATIEDIYAIFELYRERDLVPRQVVLGIDPWIFNRNHFQFRWKSLENEYRKSLRHGSAQKSLTLEESHPQANRYLQLINVEYFLAALAVARLPERNYYPTDSVELDVDIRLSDGSVSYNREYPSRSSAAVAENVR